MEENRVWCQKEGHDLRISLATVSCVDEGAGRCIFTYRRLCVLFCLILFYVGVCFLALTDGWCQEKKGGPRGGGQLAAACE